MSDHTGALVFSDGRMLFGKGIGASGERLGELVFNTSMTGYQEALSDPSYAGQILTFSYPLIGNYGFSESAFESEKSWVRGVIVSEACEHPFQNGPQKDLDVFLAEQGVPGVTGLDVRALVRQIREHGVLPAGILVADSGELPDAAARLATRIKGFDYGGVNFVQEVSGPAIKTFSPPVSERTVVLVDCGAKRGIVRDLLARDCTVQVVPFDTSANAILALKPDGVMFSNGPGDPAQLRETVAACKGLLGKVPVFGICLGHQILAQALGAKTFKLKFGHRGANHAVQDLLSGKIIITSQNHGYAVHRLPDGVTDWMANCLDGTNEGLVSEKHDAFSVQFHPEANPGPYDANHLFDRFMERMEK